MNLVKSTGTFGFFTIISRLLGYVRDFLIAIFLGTGVLADVFFVAFRIPNTFRRLFAEGTFNAAFIPCYTAARIENKTQGKKFADNILVGTIIASFQASAVSYLYYADRIYQINLAIAGIAIGVVVLPQLSKHIQSKKKKQNFINTK